jgi:hypothetical protein
LKQISRRRNSRGAHLSAIEPLGKEFQNTLCVFFDVRRCLFARLSVLLGFGWRFELRSFLAVVSIVDPGNLVRAAEVSP